MISRHKIVSICIKTLFLASTLSLAAKPAYGFIPLPNLDILSTLSYVQALLMKVGPLLSAVLFVTAGIFYAIGQFFPSYKRASLHGMSIDMIIGAIVVAALSVASTGLAAASTNLLSNITSNSL
jgi:hypothetical protein